MKTGFFIVVAAAFVGLVSGAGEFHDCAVVEPWSKTVWEAGKKVDIKWIPVAKPDPKAPKVDRIDIDLMQGDIDNANLVTKIVELLPVSDQAQTYTWSEVPDYAESDDYFVRVGTKEFSRYTHTFTIKGKGTVKAVLKPAGKETAAQSADGPDEAKDVADKSKGGKDSKALEDSKGANSTDGTDGTDDKNSESTSGDSTSSAGTDDPAAAPSSATTIATIGSTLLAAGCVVAGMLVL